MPSTRSRPKPRLKVIDWEFAALGTSWEITTTSEVEPQVRAQVTTELARFDAWWSRFRPDSQVSALADRGGSAAIDPADRQLLPWYRTLYEATAGAVNPLVGQRLSDAGYSADYRLRPNERLADVPSWDDVITVDEAAVSLSRPALLDVGAAGKGLAVDLVADILAAAGYNDFVVDGSGDMAIRGAPRRVALEHPGDPTKAIGVMTVTDRAICASAANRRVWGHWHHIVDGRDGNPTRQVVATWAVAPTAMVADGLATALFFTPASHLIATGIISGGIDFVVVWANGTVEHSGSPDVELFV